MMTKLSKLKKGQNGIRFVLFSFLLFPIFASKVVAAPGQHAVGLGLGQVMLLGDLGTGVSDGVGFNLHYTYDASQMFSLLTTLHYSSHSDEADLNSVSIKGLTPNLKINLAYIDKLSLYTYTGFGLFSAGKKTNGVEGSVTTVAFNLGGGFSLELTEHFNFGTTLTLYNLFSKNDSESRQTIGGTFMNLFVNVFYVF